jgi:hypothetical protein
MAASELLTNTVAESEAISHQLTWPIRIGTACAVVRPAVKHLPRSLRVWNPGAPFSYAIGQLVDLTTLLLQTNRLTP